MRIILPGATQAIEAPRGFAFHASYLTSRTLASVGNGLNRTDVDILGGQANIQGNTVGNSLMWMYFNLGPDGSGLGAPYQLWTQPLGVTARFLQTTMGAEGAIFLGIGDCRGSTSSDRRTNTTAKRVLLAIERNAGGARQAYFILCNGVAVGVALIDEPAQNERITIVHRPLAASASLWYGDDRMAEFTSGLPSGAATNIWADPNSVGGVGIHKTPTGAAVNRVGVLAFGQFSPDP